MRLCLDRRVRSCALNDFVFASNQIFFGGCGFDIFHDRLIWACSLYRSCVFNVSTFTSTSSFLSSLNSDRSVHGRPWCFRLWQLCIPPTELKHHGIACFISLDPFIISSSGTIAWDLLLWYAFCSSPRFTPTWIICSRRLQMKLLLKVHPIMIPWCFSLN